MYVLCVCACVYVCVCACVYVCVHICMYVHVYVHVHVHVHIYATCMHMYVEARDRPWMQVFWNYPPVFETGFLTGLKLAI